MTSRGVENLVILRLPKDDADKLREAIHSDSLKDRFKVNFYSDQRNAHVKFDDKDLSAKIVDLPCITECQKTLDRKCLYKTGDISQMMVCSEEPLSSPERLDNLPLARRRQVAKKYTFSHGLTHPLKNVRKRRFRKTASKKFIDSPEVEKELKRLLREDIQAVSVSFKVITEEGRQDDTQSVISEGDTLASRSHTPALPPDEDSIASSSFTEDAAAKSELFRMLEEASSSSSGEELEDEADEEIGVDSDDEPANPQVLQLQREVQDIEMEIEAQKMKIQNTANPTLRSRFESFLKQLEAHQQDKIDQIKNLMQ